jgi:hypothetical protein
MQIPMPPPQLPQMPPPMMPMPPAMTSMQYMEPMQDYMYAQQQSHQTPSPESYFELFNDRDFKLAVSVIGIFIVVKFIPIEKLVYQYVSLDKIPYSNFILKGIIAAVIFFVLAKTVLLN